MDNILQQIYQIPYYCKHLKEYFNAGAVNHYYRDHYTSLATGMTWSILICSLESRKADFLPKILHQLHGQLGHFTEAQEQNKFTTLTCQTFTNYPIEVIIATDNKKISVGAKRNLLTSIAAGTYISFIDDDDVVAPFYCEKILEKIKESPDVIVFDALRYENGNVDKQVKYGKEFHRDHTKQYHYRLPNHLMVWKKEIAKRVPFKEINWGEDSVWARAMAGHIRRQARITDVLYYYLFNSKTTATR